jgi:hypothetical protein
MTWYVNVFKYAPFHYIHSAMGTVLDILLSLGLLFWSL